nr:hypothetical protein HmN_000902400 [Hymenolepis microstoma]
MRPGQKYKDSASITTQGSSTSENQTSISLDHDIITSTDTYELLKLPATKPGRVSSPDNNVGLNNGIQGDDYGMAGDLYNEVIEQATEAIIKRADVYVDEAYT